MFQELDNFTRKLELANPSTRAIINAYSRSQLQRLDGAVYIPMERKHPSLEYMFSERRKQEDPIATWRKLGEPLSHATKVREMVRLLGEDILAGHGWAIAGLDGVVEMGELYAGFTPVYEESYLRVANAAKEFSASTGILVDEVFTLDRTRDGVIKRAFPDRKEHEQLYSVTWQVDQKMIAMVRGVFGVLDAAGQMDADGKDLLKKVPSDDVVDDLIAALNQHRDGEFDRIYGPRR